MAILRAFPHLGCASKTPIDGRVPPQNCRSKTTGAGPSHAECPHERRVRLAGGAPREDLPHSAGFGFAARKGAAAAKPNRTAFESLVSDQVQRAQAPGRCMARWIRVIWSPANGFRCGCGRRKSRRKNRPPSGTMKRSAMSLADRPNWLSKGKTVMLEPGDSWLVPAGAEHAYRILSEFTAVEATAPPRTSMAATAKRPSPKARCTSK